METGGRRNRAVVAVAAFPSVSRGHYRRQERGSDWARKTYVTCPWFCLRPYVQPRPRLSRDAADAFISSSYLRSPAPDQALAGVTLLRDLYHAGHKAASDVNCDYAPKSCFGSPKKLGQHFRKSRRKLSVDLTYFTILEPFWLFLSPVEHEKFWCTLRRRIHRPIAADRD
jgi:hypothetical protein